MKYFQYILLTALVLISSRLYSQRTGDSYPPEGFVYLHEVIPDIEYDIRYAGSNNFIGEPIPGYHKAVALLTTEAGEALKNVQQYLKESGYRLKVFDAYRPQQAVDHFVEWAKDPEATSMKNEFYPHVDKSSLFELGYIASRSGHTRGSTVDLTLIDSDTGKELDMGSPYDFFGKISHYGADITEQQNTNRNILRNAMEQHGFKALPEEWWHFSLVQEPYPDTYYNFPVK